MIELRHLQSFLTLAEEGHVGRAAARLGIEQSPLSRRLQALEDAVGVKLFDRTPRGITLTPATRISLRCAALAPAARRLQATGRSNLAGRKRKALHRLRRSGGL
ncbi:LysR family transcriptional regulator [Bradyrhizobium sp. USDA 4502]